MNKTRLRSHLSHNEIREKMLGTKDRAQFQRWQTIYLLDSGLKAKVVSEYVGVSKGTVHQWVFRYNHEGPEALVLHGRGGRRYGLMGIEEEKKFLEDLRDYAEKGQIAGAFAIRKHVEKRLGKKVSKDYLYDLLHRHGWRKVVPRPEHPEVDKEKQKEFKKNFRKRWRSPAKVFLQKTKGR